MTHTRMLYVASHCICVSICKLITNQMDMLVIKLHIYTHIQRSVIILHVYNILILIPCGLIPYIIKYQRLYEHQSQEEVNQLTITRWPSTDCIYTRVLNSEHITIRK